MGTSDQQSTSLAGDAIDRLQFEVDWPPYHVAAYLLDGDAPILVDAGVPEDGGRAAMIDRLDDHGYDPADLGAVVVTHPHTDHTGQVPLFREAGVPVYAPQAALDQLNRDEKDLVAGVREIGRSVGLDAERLETEAERACDSLRRNSRLLDPDHATGFGFGESFTVAGQPFEAIHTPGHQIHHASLAATIDGESVMFSGDTLIEPFRAAALHVGIDYGAYEAIDAYYDSMETYAGRDVDCVYPGHGPIFTDYAGTVAGTREKLDDLVGDTLAAVEVVGPATPLTIVDERVGETSHPAHLLDTLGALGTLEHRGEVEYHTDEGVRSYETV
jgi:glyoxylase-like metal-dependent hydrolase (beta-lactamase superfamily II)